MKAKITALMLGLLASTSVFAVVPPDHAMDRIPVNNGTQIAAFNGSPAQIPEPGTLALIATGLAGLAISRRRRKR